MSDLLLEYRKLDKDTKEFYILTSNSRYESAVANEFSESLLNNGAVRVLDSVIYSTTAGRILVKGISDLSINFNQSVNYFLAQQISNTVQQYLNAWGYAAQGNIVAATIAILLFFMSSILTTILRQYLEGRTGGIDRIMERSTYDTPDDKSE